MTTTRFTFNPNGSSKECCLCHRLGSRGFTPVGGEDWEGERPSLQAQGTTPRARLVENSEYQRPQPGHDFPAPSRGLPSPGGPELADAFT